jgi:RimJ/RimL family protein N-acetyltransferase
MNSKERILPVNIYHFYKSNSFKEQTLNMKYMKEITLKDGRKCLLRNSTPEDAQAVLENFILTHAQSDFLASYPEETTFTMEQEVAFLQKKLESENELHLIAEVDGKVAGTAGIDALSTLEKMRHRASFGISIDRAYWGLGIGRAMAEACIECAKKAGFSQLELDVVADNERAVNLYRSLGFTEYGRNPRGMRSRTAGWQTFLLMRMDLDGES